MLSRFNMFFKLFIALGLTWSLEIIAWIIITTKTDVPQWFAVVLSIANVLQGFVVFAIFGLKASARKNLKQRAQSMRMTTMSRSTSYTTTQLLSVRRGSSDTRRGSSDTNEEQGFFMVNQPRANFNPNINS